MKISILSFLLAICVGFSCQAVIVENRASKTILISDFWVILSDGLVEHLAEEPRILKPGKAIDFGATLKRMQIRVEGEDWYTGYCNAVSLEAIIFSEDENGVSRETMIRKEVAVQSQTL